MKKLIWILMRKYQFLLLILVRVNLSFAADSLVFKSRAIELEYTIYACQNTDKKNDALFELAALKTQQKHFKEAILEIHKVEALNEKQKYQQLFELGKNYYLSNAYDSADIYCNQIDSALIDSANKAQLVLLKVLILNDSRRYNESELIMKQYLSKLNINLLEDSAYLSLKSNLASDFHSKIRYLGLPGGGLFYINRDRQALTNIALCSMAILYAGYSIYNGLYFTAALTGGSNALRFYRGGKRAALFFYNEQTEHKYKVKSALLNEFFLKFF